jgi:hypothetical protein
VLRFVLSRKIFSFFGASCDFGNFRAKEPPPPPPPPSPREELVRGGGEREGKEGGINSFDFFLG